MARVLFVHRRDLRAVDNRALNYAYSLGPTQPLFIIDPRQVGETNEYRSEHALHFLRESLRQLDASYQKEGGSLLVKEGVAEEVVASLVQSGGYTHVVVGRDYTPFARSRDGAIKKVVEEYGAVFAEIDDALLTAPEMVIKGTGGAYKVFTPFWKTASAHTVDAPHTEKGALLKEVDIHIDDAVKRIGGIPSTVVPGRDGALRALDDLIDQKNYAVTRDVVSDYTTRISAHLKFGTVSAREVYWRIRDTLGGQHALIRQLYWRDFFTHIGFHFPHVFGGAFNQTYNNLSWNGDAGALERWCTGATGVPIVDAGMRELNETGYMHNRVRMITASFLVKDLHIDWRKGERYFATRLVDYDPAVNNGNWQWVAGTGADAAPYFRIFNPYTQAKKFDPECVYIKRWVPELKDLPPKAIHAHSIHPVSGYPAPMVDHSKEAKATLAQYKSVVP